MAAMPELVSSVRLLDGRWVGTCPDCGRDVPMKLWEYELRVHNTRPRRGVRCPGSGKVALNADKVSDRRIRGWVEEFFVEERRDADARPTPALMWAEDGPGQHCAMWRGDRIYVVREGDEWVVRRPGWPKSDVRIDGHRTLSGVQHAVAHVFAK